MSSDCDSVPVRRKGGLPLASQLVLAYKNIIDVLCDINTVVWFTNPIPPNEPIEN